MAEAAALGLRGGLPEVEAARGAVWLEPAELDDHADDAEHESQGAQVEQSSLGAGVDDVGGGAPPPRGQMDT